MSEENVGIRDLPATGERFIPGAYENQQMVLEHYQRYINACHYCAGKDVLDIASGEGYGSDILAHVARKVIGIDIAGEAVRHAEKIYGERANLRFIKGSVDAIPLEDHSIDMVVSFETIEHVDASCQQRMLAEIRRVLRPGGLLMISSPNKSVYTDERKEINPFHEHELYRQDFVSLIGKAFRNIKIGDQSFLQGCLLAWSQAAIESTRFPSKKFADGLTGAMYTVVLASDGELPAPVSSMYESTDFVCVESALHKTQEALMKTQHALEDTLGALKDKMDEVDSCREVIATTNAALEKTDRKALEAESALHDVKKCLDNTRYELQRTQDELREKIAEVSSCRETIAERDSSLKLAEGQITSAEAVAHRAQENLTRTQHEIEALRDNLERATVSQEELKKHALALQHDVATREKALHDTQEALIGRIEVLKGAELEIARLRGTLGYRLEYKIRRCFTIDLYRTCWTTFKQKAGGKLHVQWQGIKGRIYAGRATVIDRMLFRMLKPYSTLVKHYLAPKQIISSPHQKPAESGLAAPTESPVAQICYDAWYEGDEDYSGKKSDVKPIAFYLPQFHTFKENDEWWGKGFTEWTNTRKSKPRFVSHYQPREPHADIGYYDLSDWRVLQQQANLARKHGIYGFCFYNYWFSGKRLMEKPVDLFLAHPEIDIHFCLCWANENWTRAWDGGADQILIGQGYENDSLQYIIDLKKYIDDPRYIRVNGKPVVMIYRPGLLPDAKKTFTCWREWARTNGIGEILIWIQRGCSQNGDSLMIEGADAEIEFPPNGTAAFNHVDPGIVGLEKGDGYLLNYKDLVQNVTAGRGYVETYNHDVYRGVMLGWDNAARRKTGFCTWYGFSLPDYYRWCRYVVEDTRKRHDKDDRIFFINAWNEWAEGTYLEPDKRFGYASLNVTARALFNLPLHPRIIGSEKNEVDKVEEFKADNLLGRGIPLFPYGLYWMYHTEMAHVPAVAWSHCNAQPDPMKELTSLRTRFVNDEQSACKKLGLKRIFIDEMPPLSGPVNDRIAVHLHLFYPDMLEFVLGYLANIPSKYDLYISIPEGVDCNEDEIRDSVLKTENIGDVCVKRCPNRGRDIAPLVCTFGRDLVKYDYVAHFHTKKSLHTPSHNIWARFIFDHLLGTKDRVRRIFGLMQSDCDIVSPADFLMMPEEPSGWGSNMSLAQGLVDRAGLKIDLQKEFPVIEFPQGSMFWARVKSVKHLLTLPVKVEDFPAEPVGTDGTIAHALERLFFIWGLPDNRGVRQIYLPGEEDAFARNR